MTPRIKRPLRVVALPPSFLYFLQLEDCAISKSSAKERSGLGNKLVLLSFGSQIRKYAYRGIKCIMKFTHKLRLELSSELRFSGSIPRDSLCVAPVLIIEEISVLHACQQCARTQPQRKALFVRTVCKGKWTVLWTERTSVDHRFPSAMCPPAKHRFPELSTVTNIANWLIPSFPILIHNSIKKWCNQVGVPLSLGCWARSTRLWRTLFWFCKKTLSVFIFSWKGLSGRILKVPREVMHLRNICSFKQTLKYLSDTRFLDSNRKVAQKCSACLAPVRP